jgi:serine/threonine protein kinase/Tfp pilus assembly protein PilF
VNKDRLPQIEALFHQALGYAPEARAAYLKETCAGDEELRREVEALLAYGNTADDFIERPALEIAARLINDESLAETATTNIQLPTPAQIGPYKLQTPLGKGGMGEVHLALDTRLGRKVALKLLPAEFTQDRERVQRFTQEARAASALNHQNIIIIYEIGQAEHSHYIATEYVEGETLRTRLNNAPHKRLAPAKAVELAIQLATALAAAHEAGIIHRDIKPENVMLRRDGLVKVLDFGLAKLTEQQLSEIVEEAGTGAQVKTRSGVVLGTASYMSPEQARGLEVDARSDLFSLGAVLYEMVAGHAPFRGATLTDILLAVIDKEPPPIADAPAALQQIISKALRKERAERYQSSQDLLADLKAWQQGQAVSRASFVLPISRPLRKSRLAILGLTLTLLAAATIYFSFFSNPAFDSLAVLPFVNVGANPDADYLSDGITDGLINSLSRLPKLRVMSHSAVLRYKGKESDAQVAGQALGVRAVLTGKVTQRGDDLLISAELVDVRDNSHLWGEEYSYKLSNLLSVQPDLARDVSQQLRLRLSSAEQQQLTKRGTENAEAYDFYLKGRHLMDSLADHNHASSRFFQLAVEKDPSFALAWAGLAEAYIEKAGLGTTLRLAPKEAYPPAKNAAEKAVALDDTLPETHVSLARIAFQYEWDWPRAEREFQRAIALKANYVPALHWYSHYLVFLGRFDESLVVSQRALAPDPLSVEMNYHLGFHYWNARQFDLAVMQLQKALAEKPNFSNAHGMLGTVYAIQGRYQEAIAEVLKSRSMSDNDNRGSLGHVYAVAGQRDEARKLLTQLQEEAKTKIISPYRIAMIYAGLDEKDQAFAWLEKAIAERDGNLTFPGLKVDTRIDNLRSDARFVELLRRMGLSQ